MSLWTDFKENVLDKSDAVKKFLFFLQIVWLVLSALSLVIYTMFTISALKNSWNNPVLNYIVLGFLGACVILFIVLVTLNIAIKNPANAQLKNYRLTVRGIRLTLMMFNFILTFFVLFSSIFAGNANGGQFLAMIVSATLLAFHIFFWIWRIKKARKKHIAIRDAKQQEVSYYDHDIQKHNKH